TPGTAKVKAVKTTSVIGSNTTTKATKPNIGVNKFRPNNYRVRPRSGERRGKRLFGLTDQGLGVVDHRGT
ncbi:hypothetical protein AAGG49_23245, partial [Stenotrophomonas maltophilia]|uniref:hypothetical protein n=1 Tax=Stenotrophomonas maltophilia TaxID=40324 RepID=UPI00313B2800